MEQNIKTPKQLLKEYFCKTGILLIGIFLSVSLICGIIAAFKVNNPLERLLNVASLLKIDVPESLTKASNMITTGLIISKIIPLLPLMMLTLGTWLIYAEGKGKLQREGLGAIIIWRYMFVKLVLAALVVLVFLVLFIILLTMGVGAALVIIGLITLIFVAGFEFAVGLYYWKFADIFKKMSMTCKGSGKNYIYVYKYVIILNWILAISGFFNFSSFWAFLSAALNSVMIIIITVLMNRYTKEVALLDNDAYPDEVASKPNAVGVASKSNTIRTANNVNRNMAFTELSPKLLTLFNDAIDEECFTLDGENVFDDSINSKIPIRLALANIYIDSISGRKLLQLEIKRNVKIGVASIELDLSLSSNNGPVGIIKNLEYKVENDSVAKFGLVIPDEVTNGTIKIKKIIFEDELYWNKECEDYSFYTSEFVDHSAPVANPSEEVVETMPLDASSDTIVDQPQEEVVATKEVDKEKVMGIIMKVLHVINAALLLGYVAFTPVVNGLLNGMGISLSYVNSMYLSIVFAFIPLILLLLSSLLKNKKACFIIDIVLFVFLILSFFWEGR